MARLSDSITYGNHAITGNVSVGGTLTINGVEFSAVGLTGGSNVTVSGSYPNFTISAVDTNTNTTYSAGTGITLSGTTFSLTDERFTSVLLSKLNGIETGAEVNRTKSEIDALGINAGTVDGINSTQFVRSDADDTVSGVLTFTNGNPIDVRRGISGGYGDSNGSGSNWGVNIWGMGDAYAGSGAGTSFTVGNYQIAWLRGAHASADSNASEGMYVFSQNVYCGAIGISGAHFPRGVTTTTLDISSGRVGSNATRNLTVSTAEPSGGSDGDVWYVVE